MAGAIANPVELKVSDLGSKITYVPLETTDSTVLPEKVTITLTEDNVLVPVTGINMPGQLYAFNLADGKFVAKIGHAGHRCFRGNGQIWG